MLYCKLNFSHQFITLDLSIPSTMFLFSVFDDSILYLLRQYMASIIDSIWNTHRKSPKENLILNVFGERDCCNFLDIKNRKILQCHLLYMPDKRLFGI